MSNNQETHICKYCGAETRQSDDECYAKPKSSIEYYIANLIDILGDEICKKISIEQNNRIINLERQAKAMHQLEIRSAFNEGKITVLNKTNLTSQQYYENIQNND